MTNKNHRILIVDDDQNLRRLMHETLEAIGYLAVSASDGLDAIKLVKTEQIDLVIADISMPEMDGLQLLQQIKDYNPKIPVLLITGVNMNNIKDRVYQYGADAFLDKPFRIAKIEEMLDRLLANNIQPAKVLVVDDNKEFREHFAAQLEEMGFRVIEAADGGEALEKLSRDHIDSVVTDWRMPNIDGVELAKRLKSDSPFTHVVIISGQAISLEDQEMLRNTADAFLSKPFRLDELKNMLNRFARKALA
jgi:CheY-like chemotaxis protein